MSGIGGVGWVRAVGSAAAIAAAVLVSMAVPIAARGATWGQFGLNPWHSSFNHSETILSRSTVSHLKLAWSRSFRVDPQGPAPGYATPVVSNGDVYSSPEVQLDGPVVAYNAKTGTLDWATGTTDRYGEFALAYANNAIFGTGQADNDSFNATTGARNWGHDALGGGLNAVAGTRLFEGFGDGVASVLQVDGGSNAWSFGFPSISPGGSATNPVPAITHSQVYAVSGEYLAAVSEANGVLVWQKAIDPACACLSSPSVTSTGGTVYVGGGALYAVSGSTGPSLWTQKHITGVGTPADANGVLYV